MDLEPAKRVNGRMWQPGQSGNPLGRPIGARGRFSQQFIEDMRASWRKHGATVMDRVKHASNPADFPVISLASSTSGGAAPARQFSQFTQALPGLLLTSWRTDARPCATVSAERLMAFP